MESVPSQRLSGLTKFFYGLGEAGEGVKTAALETFLFFYYVQVVGLSGSLTGAALFIALLVDGISDPLVGSLSDRTRSRFGRRHPYLYAAPVPLAVALFLLFSPPTGWPEIGQFAWLAVFAIASRIAMTFYFVPHMALGAELSADFRERVAIGGVRTFFGYVGRILAMIVAFAVFFKASPEFKNGQLNPAAYQPFALVCGVMVIAFVIVSALATQRAALALPPRRKPKVERAPSVVRTFRAAWTSKSFRALFIALLILYVFNGVQYALALHMNTYFWRLAPRDLQMVFYATQIGFICGIPFVRPLASRFDKKATYMAGVIASGSMVAIPTTLRLLGFLPPGEALAPILIGANFLYGFLGASAVVLSAAMLADLTDEHEAAHGERAEGVFFGVNAFCRKASLGLGGAIAGVIIDLIGFPAKAPPGSVPAEDLTRLGLVFGPGIFLVLLVGIASLAGYAMDRRRHAFILRELAVVEP